MLDKHQVGDQKSLHSPVDLAMHFLFITQESIHVTFGQKRLVVETCIRAVTFNPGSAVMGRLE